MTTFFGEPTVKAALLARLEGHRIADEYVQGQYWEKGKGCFIGCAVHSDEVEQFEQTLGLSPYIARLGEYFFEAFDPAQAKRVPLEIIEAIPVGVDDTMVWPRLWQWIVNDSQYGLLHYNFPNHIQVVIRGVQALYTSWPAIDPQAAIGAAIGAARAATGAARAAAGGASGAAAGVAGAAWAAGAARVAQRQACYAQFLTILRELGPQESVSVEETPLRKIKASVNI